MRAEPSGQARKVRSRALKGEYAMAPVSSSSSKPGRKVGGPAEKGRLRKAAQSALPGADAEGGLAGGFRILKKAELIDRVMQASGSKRKDARAIVEVTLATLGQALVAGEELQLPPLGKLRVQKRKTGDTAEVLTLKLRRPNPEKAGKSDKEGLAPDGEED